MTCFFFPTVLILEYQRCGGGKTFGHFENSKFTNFSLTYLFSLRAFVAALKYVKELRLHFIIIL